jgi:hypothetical protein
MKKLIRQLLIGDTPVSEYVNVTEQESTRPKVFLEAGALSLDISNYHWLLCIEPVIMGVWVDKQVLPKKKCKGQTCSIYFYEDSPAGSDKKDTLAVLTMEFFGAIEEDNGTLLLLEIVNSDIRHLNALKRYMLFRRYYKKEGLSFASFKSFVAAYSYPRRIRLVSFRQGDDYFNIFPMDLVGDISMHNRYVFGLRHSNIALPQIIESGKLVVIETPFEYKDAIYKLGKHHSSSPPSPGSLPFNTINSGQWQFYVPSWAESYKEISIRQTIDMGSHMLLWGQPVYETTLAPPSGHLFLEHFLYYMEQKNKGIIHQTV